MVPKPILFLSSVILGASLIHGIFPLAHANDQASLARTEPVRFQSERDGSDTFFIETMMIAHRNTIALSDAFLQRPPSPIADTVVSIRDAHQQEWQYMKEQYPVWFEDAAPVALQEGSVGIEIPSSDEAYIQDIIRRHKKTINLAQETLMHTRRGDIAELCQEIIYLQTQQIKELTEIATI